MKSLNLWPTVLDGYVNICVFLLGKVSGFRVLIWCVGSTEFKCNVQLDFSGK